MCWYALLIVAVHDVVVAVAVGVVCVVDDGEDVDVDDVVIRFPSRLFFSSNSSFSP